MIEHPPSKDCYGLLMPTSDADRLLQETGNVTLTCTDAELIRRCKDFWNMQNPELTTFFSTRIVIASRSHSAIRVLISHVILLLDVPVLYLTIQFVTVYLEVYHQSVGFNILFKSQQYDHVSRTLQTLHRVADMLPSHSSIGSKYITDASNTT